MSHDPNAFDNPTGNRGPEASSGHWNPQAAQASAALGAGGQAAYAGGRPIAAAVATLGANERLVFIRKTYAHLAGAIFAFAFLCWLWLNPLVETVAIPLSSWAIGGYNWLLFLGAFIAVSWLADKWARSDVSRKMQYAGLGLYVFAQSLLFVPLLLIAHFYGGEGVIATAAVITLLIFGGLSATVFFTRKDFSFLAPALGIVSMAALGLILVSILFGFSLGIFFCWAMVVLASGYILFTTSRILAHYHPEQYVAASLGLFAAVALLFWYVIQIVMDR